VVIVIPQEATADGDLLARVTANYRSRGYRLAVASTLQHDMAALEGVQPDFLQLDVGQFSSEQELKPFVDHAHGWGGRTLVTHIEAARELVIAVRAGADAMQGYFLGRPDFENVRQPRLTPVPAYITRAESSGRANAAPHSAHG